MPSSAGGAGRGSSTVLTISLPMATPCSLTPCSAPHSHAGRDSTVAAGAGVGELRYWVRRAGSRVAPDMGLDHLGLGDGPVRVLGEEGAVPARGRTGCHTWVRPDRDRAQAAPLSGCQPARSRQTGVVGEDLDDRCPQAQALLDALDVEDLVPQHQRGHHARAPGARRAARAVQVGLVVLGRVVVHDHVDVVDVEAPGGHVGGHQHVQLARGEVLERLLAARLAEVAVDGGGPHPFLPSCSTRRSAPRLVRTNTRALLAPRQIAATTFTLSIWWTCRKRCSIDSTVGVTDATSWRTGSCRWRFTTRSTSPSRVAENNMVWCGDSMRRSTHSTWGRNPMSAMRSASSSTTTSRSGHRHGLTVGEVDQAPRRGDHDVDALVELLDLALDVGAAVDDDDPLPAGFAEGLEHVGHLDGELAGGHEHERPGAVGAARCRRISRGRPKARVLPEPVLALPHTSRPAMPSGMVSAWTGNGAVMPCECRTATSSGATPSCSKVEVGMGSGASTGSGSSSSAGPRGDGHDLRLTCLRTAAHRPRGGPASMTPPRPLGPSKNR